ncbi:MAG: DUF6531 domain-containing protein [Synergistaceae bacterium]|nr:DUF6531 domain-containing protein [Synergistaceae bacterium]
MDFQLSIPTLERVIKLLDKALVDINSIKKEVSQAADNLTTNGWKGESSEVFSGKSGQWEDDFSVYINNLLLIRDTLKKVLDLSENLNRQALSFAGLFGGNASGAKNLLSLSRQAKAAVCRNCQKAIDEYDRYRSDLQKLKQLNNSFRYSKLSVLNEINSSSREIEGCQNSLGKLMEAINKYEKGVDELEQTMKRWESGFVRSKRWSEFVGQFIEMLGDIGLRGIAAFTEANSIGAFIASLFGVNNTCCSVGGDPVNLATGNFIYQKEYLKTKGLFPMSFGMIYNALEQRRNSLGFGWVHSFEASVSDQEDKATVFLEDGKQEIFIKSDRGQYYQSQGADNSLKKKNDNLIYQAHSGLKYIFDQKGKLTGKEDRNGNYIKLIYDEAGILQKAENNSSSSFSFSYENDKLRQVTDNAGRTVSFEYEEDTLICVADENGGKYQYGYMENKLAEIVNPCGVNILNNKYDKAGRIKHQAFPDSGEILYEYKDDEKKLILTQQNGNEITYVHDERYRSVGTIYSDGFEKYEYNDQNLRTLFIDKKGNETKYSYDGRGNTIKVTNPLGETVETEYNRLNKPVRVKLSGDEKIRMSYDSHGNVTEVVDAIGCKTKTDYDKNGHPVKITQPDGSEVTLEYDSQGNIITISEPMSETKYEYEYDELNRVITTSDGNGNRTGYEYNARDDITKVVSADGHKRGYEYDANGKVIKITDFDGGVIKSEYNCLGKPSKITDQEGNEVEFEYDLMWNVSKQVDANGGVTSFEYDKLNRLERVINANGSGVRYEYDPNGNRTKITNPRGDDTYLSYDPLNRISEIIEPGGAKTGIEYNNMGQVTGITDPLGHKSVFAYDKAGRKISETDVTGRELKYSYTPLGHISRITDPAGRITTFDYMPGGLLERATYPDGRSTVYAYDANKNITSQTSQDGYALNYEYNCLNQITCIRSNKGQIKKYAYDAVGNIISITDANNSVTGFAYSPSGKLISVIDPLGNRSEYDYDRQGNLIEVKQFAEVNEAKKINEQNTKLHVTEYKRDKSGQIEKIIDAIGNAEAYTYDEMGNVLSKLDQDGFLTKYAYNKSNQLEEVKYPDGKSVKLSYNPLKQLIGIKDWLGITAIEVDEAGRAKKVTDHSGKEVAYTYGAEGQRTGIVYPDGKSVEYRYDEFLRLKALIDGNNQIEYVYDQNSRLSDKIFSNGVRTQFSYNDTGLLSELTHSDREGVLDKYVYTYDSMMNKTCVEEFRRGMEEEGGKYQYAYDELSRLTGVTKDNTPIKKFGYDGYGNRDFAIDKGVRTDYAYNPLNQLTRLEGANRVQDFYYDARGNLTQILENDSIRNTYEYSPLNRLTRAVNAAGQASNYEYNGLGFRVGKQITDDLNPAKNISYTLDLTKRRHNLLQMSDDTRTQTFVWDDNVVSSVDETGGHIFLQDDLGSPLRYIDGLGNLTDSYAYDEFGNDLTGNQSIAQPFGYTGYQYDNIAQTYFAQAREYEPLLGCFTGVDAVKGFIGAPLSLHPYAYCRNNPLIYTDSTGCAIDLSVLNSPGEIHRQVQYNIRMLNPSITIERWLRYNNPLYNPSNRRNPLIPATLLGRVDLLDRYTGYIWEIKPEGWPPALAQAQLANYSTGTFLGRAIRNLTPIIYNGLPGAPEYNLGTRANPNTFSYQNSKAVFEVEYWYEGDGIISYDFQATRLKKQEQTETQPETQLQPQTSLEAIPITVDPEAVAEGVTAVGVLTMIGLVLKAIGTAALDAAYGFFIIPQSALDMFNEQTFGSDPCET